MSKRQPHLYALIGINGTGKTYYAINNILKNIKNDRYLVIDSDGKEDQWHNLRGIDISDKQDMKTFKGGVFSSYSWYSHLGKEGFWLEIYKNALNCTIIFDDCRDFIPSNILEIPKLKNIFSRRRQRNTDVLLLQHSADDIAKGLARYSNVLIAFQTQDTPRGVATRFGDKRIFRNIERINKLANIKGNQYHPVANKHYCEVIPLRNFP